MSRLRSAFVLQLLLAAGAAAALVPTPACTHCDAPWGAPEDFELATDATILGDYWDPFDGSQIVVGTGGAVVELLASPRIHRPVDVDLHGVTAGEELIIVVGVGGTVAAAPRGSTEWQVVDIGTSADLHAAATVKTGAGERQVVVGDGVVFVREPITGTWAEIPPPEGGWGELRAIHSEEFTPRITVVGRGGVIWSAADPQGPWRREQSGTSEDLTSVHEQMIGGNRGTLLRRDEAGGWGPVPVDTSADIVDVFPALLTSEGEVFEDVNYDGTSFERIARLGPGLHVIVEAGLDLLILGEPDKHRHLANLCPPYEGRPFVVDAEIRTAAAVARADWCAPGDRPASPARDPELRAALADAWTHAALAEHASIAAFARAVLELMSLGAPAELVRETQAALADEVEHAARSFTEASRHAEHLCGPGPLATEGAVLARVGDPAAVALGVFVEGCVGEGVSAAETALAAEGCRDPGTRALLELLARDELRHAALAWKTLRWLIDRFGEVVAAPLRHVLATLQPPLARAAGLDLRAHGRLSARARCLIHRDVVREVVRPLADALLARAAPEVRT